MNIQMLADVELLIAARQLIHDRYCQVTPDLKSVFGDTVCCPVCQSLQELLQSKPPYVRVENRGGQLTAWIGTQIVPVVLEEPRETWKQENNNG